MERDTEHIIIRQTDLRKLAEYEPELITLFELFLDANISISKNIYNELRRIVQEVDDNEKLLSAEVVELRREVGRLMEIVNQLRPP